MDSDVNPVIHFEIGCKNQSETSKFYQTCFGWEIIPGKSLDTVHTKSKVGIQGHITSAVTEIERYITFYIEVTDIQKTLAIIEKEGGEIIVPILSLPNGKQFAWFNDVAGNTIGIITKKNNK